MRRREPATEPDAYPARLATFTEDWPAPKPGSPFDELVTRDGWGREWVVRNYRRMQWQRARLAWEREHDPEYQQFVANGYRRNG